MLFYTGKGGAGTSFIGKKKIPKDSYILEALGELDELNCLLGLVRNVLSDKKMNKNIEHVQEHLFIIQARIAWLLFPKFRAPQLDKKKISLMEQEIERMEKFIRPERGFIVPGSNIKSAWLDFARAISRRAERRVYAVSKKKKLPEEILMYMNRLSSYLYALAGMEAQHQHIYEQNPSYH